jgi:hypothetical protein
MNYMVRRSVENIRQQFEHRWQSNNDNGYRDNIAASLIFIISVGLIYYDHLLFLEEL